MRVSSRRFLIVVGKMRITLNGDEREIPSGMSIAALVEELGLARDQVAVERNRELVSRALHAEMVLAEGDEVEVVTLVGGG